MTRKNKHGNERTATMNKTITVTNLFTGKTTTYATVNAFRKDAKDYYDESVASLIDKMSEAYADGRPTGTYEWMLGVSFGKAA